MGEEKPGVLEAERIRKQRENKANRAAQEAREGEILKTDQLLFFKALVNDLAETVKNFNSEMHLAGNDTVTFEATSNTQISIGKRKPFFLKKIMHREASDEVLIRTNKPEGNRAGEREEKWQFRVTKWRASTQLQERWRIRQRVACGNCRPL